MMKFISKKLKQAREKKGVSQERMIQDLAINGYRMSRNTLCRYESGKCNPSIDGLINLSRYLDLPLGSFFSNKTLVKN
jgi:transcriptional regulator with XRE-family HTH domain